MCRTATQPCADAEVFTSQAHLLEALPPGSSKGAGLKWLLDDLGLDPAQVMAIGDGDNDIEMLQLVGLGVAMANATRPTDNNRLKVASIVLSSTAVVHHLPGKSADTWGRSRPMTGTMML